MYKQSLRSWARTQAKPTAEEAISAVQNLEKWFEVRSAGTGVLAYRAMPGEIDLEPLLQNRADLVWLTTRTPPVGPLTVHPYHGSTEMHPLGFRQPTSDTPMVKKDSIQVVICPGLLFDRSGGRLGRGKGYYDQLLVSLPAEVVKIGLTIERFLLPKLPMSHLDQPMDWIITDRKTRKADVG